MSDDIGALQEESGKAIISRAFDTLNRHWLPWTNSQMSEFLEATRNAVIESGMMLRLYPHVLDLVSIQFGRPPQDVSTNDAVYQYSFKQRWPSEYSQIIANDKDGNTETRRTGLEAPRYREPSSVALTVPSGGSPGHRPGAWTSMRGARPKKRRIMRTNGTLSETAYELA
jgi:hypothetical protein